MAGKVDKHSIRNIAPVSNIRIALPPTCISIPPGATLKEIGSQI